MEMPRISSRYTLPYSGEMAVILPKGLTTRDFEVFHRKKFLKALHELYPAFKAITRKVHWVERLDDVALPEASFVFQWIDSEAMTANFLNFKPYYMGYHVQSAALRQFMGWGAVDGHKVGRLEMGFRFVWSAMAIVEAEDDPLTDQPDHSYVLIKKDHAGGVCYPKVMNKPTIHLDLARVPLQRPTVRDD